MGSEMCIRDSYTTVVYVSFVACMWLNACSKVRSFVRDVKNKFNIMSLEVDRACDSDRPFKIFQNRAAL